MGGFGLLNELCYVVPCLFVYLNVNYKAGFPFLSFRAPPGLLRLDDSSFIQGELGRSGTTFSFSGACLFRRPRRVALYRSRSSPTPSREPITRGDWAISARNSDLSMPLTFLHFTTLLGTRGLERSVPIVSKKWSDMYRLSTLTEVTSVLALHKTMSKMWPFTCVGSVTNWSKPSGLYNWTKRRVSGSLGLSMWKLKSPTTSTFSAGMLSSERNMPNSSMKSEVVSLFPADGGGRYTEPSRIVCLPLVMHTSVFSNELKERCLHNRTLRCCRKMRATPPPLTDTRGLWRKENPGGVISPMLTSSPSSLSQVSVRHSTSRSLSTIMSFTSRALLTADLAFHTPTMTCVAFLGRGAELQVGESGGDEGLLTTGGEPTVNGRQGLQPAETSPRWFTRWWSGWSLGRGDTVVEGWSPGWPQGRGDTEVEGWSPGWPQGSGEVEGWSPGWPQGRVTQRWRGGRLVDHKGAVRWRGGRLVDHRGGVTQWWRGGRLVDHRGEVIQWWRGGRPVEWRHGVPGRGTGNARGDAVVLPGSLVWFLADWEYRGRWCVETQVRIVWTLCLESQTHRLMLQKLSNPCFFQSQGLNWWTSEETQKVRARVRTCWPGQRPQR